ncbi:hypothetical protein [Actinomadura sp. 7K534]|uniref:hypothetical protein n=1 Tax=Actinomadura sp. 7K534 TaxID=2530366 RepID=UPI00104EACCC|nr:hypothetical protein [Actinomadura sp. 7K534]TDB97627.1 hypothetical protein E1266_06135 [Actinomadura sp. 7K534]
MSTEATILPGFPPLSGKGADCRGRNCPIKVAKPLKGDTIEAWHTALENGQESAAAHLQQFNAHVQHKNDCRFRNLPPSVHHWARSRGKGYDDLVREAERLESMGYHLS